MLARLERIGWNDDAFRAVALHGEGDVKFHEGLGRAAEDARSLDRRDLPSFWVRIDGVDFTKWSRSTRGEAARRRRPRRLQERGGRDDAPLRQKGLGVVAAYTQATRSRSRAGSATKGGAPDPSRRLATLFTSAFRSARAGAARDEARGRRRAVRRVAAAATRSAASWRCLAPPRRNADASSQARGTAVFVPAGSFPPVDGRCSPTMAGAPRDARRKALMASAARTPLEPAPEPPGGH